MDMKHYIRAWSKAKHGPSYYKSKKLKNKYNRSISSCCSTEDFKGLNPRNKVKDIDTMLKLVRKNTKFKNST